MFKRKRHIYARNNEWLVVHRNSPRTHQRDLPQIVGVSLGCLILAALIWEFIKATYPLLIVGAIIVVIVYFVRKSS